MTADCGLCQGTSGGCPAPRRARRSGYRHARLRQGRCLRHARCSVLQVRGPVAPPQRVMGGAPRCSSSATRRARPAGRRRRRAPNATGTRPASSGSCARQRHSRWVAPRARTPGPRPHRFAIAAASRPVYRGRGRSKAPRSPARRRRPPAPPPTLSRTAPEARDFVTATSSTLRQPQSAVSTAANRPSRRAHDVVRPRANPLRAVHHLTILLLVAHDLVLDRAAGGPSRGGVSTPDRGTEQARTPDGRLDTRAAHDALRPPAPPRRHPAATSPSPPCSAGGAGGRGRFCAPIPTTRVAGPGPRSPPPGTRWGPSGDHPVRVALVAGPCRVGRQDSLQDAAEVPELAEHA